MRDDPTLRGIPPQEVNQPNSVAKSVGPFRLTLAALAGAAVIVFVLYGMSHGPQQTATAPQPSAVEPTTTGQASPPPARNGDQAQSKAKESQPGKSQHSDSATTGKASAPSETSGSPEKK